MSADFKPPMHNAFVGVGCTRFGDGLIQTETSLVHEIGRYLEETPDPEGANPYIALLINARATILAGTDPNHDPRPARTDPPKAPLTAEEAKIDAAARKAYTDEPWRPKEAIPEPSAYAYPRFKSSSDEFSAAALGSSVPVGD